VHRAVNCRFILAGATQNPKSRAPGTGFRLTLIPDDIFPCYSVIHQEDSLDLFLCSYNCFLWQSFFIHFSAVFDSPLIFLSAFCIILVICRVRSFTLIATFGIPIGVPIGLLLKKNLLEVISLYHIFYFGPFLFFLEFNFQLVQLVLCLFLFVRRELKTFIFGQSTPLF